MAKWTLHPTPWSTTTAADFRVTGGIGQIVAMAFFRKHGAALGDPIAVAERQSAVVKAARDLAQADSAVVEPRRQLADLKTKEGVLTYRLGDIAAKLEAIALRRTDPALIDAQDAGRQLLEIDREELSLAERQREDLAALNGLAQHLRGAQERYERAVAEAAQRAIAKALRAGRRGSQKRRGQAAGRHAEGIGSRG